jgi:hypothetical protein
MLGDEVWNWSDREPTLLGAMSTALVKNPAAKLLLISTAAPMLDSPLGRLRTRALSQPHVKRTGSLLEAHGDGLRWLEWSVPDDVEPTPDAVKRATPAPWITLAALRAQHKRVTPVEWLQFHACRWGVSSARWLPPGAWDDCRADYTIGDDERLVLGLDVGGSRSATALVGCVADAAGVRVALVEVWQGRAAVLQAEQRIRELAQTRPIACLVYDPMRAEHLAQAVERDHGVLAVEWPQSETRMTLCSENLHRLVVEQRLRHAGDPQLDAHVANAVAKPTPRGWRLTKAADSLQVDALIALAMSAEVAERQPRPVEIVGWL